MSTNQPYIERDLLMRIANGDESAFRQVVDHYQSIIFTTAYRLSGNKELSEDVVQDVFLKVWLSRQTIADMDNFGGWLYTVAKNILLNAVSGYHREKSYQRNVVSQSPPRASMEDQSIDERDLQALLAKTILRLPEKQRQAYILVKEQGLTRQQAAEKLHVSPETIKSNLDLAMRFLRAQMQFLLLNRPLGMLFFLLTKLF